MPTGGATVTDTDTLPGLGIHYGPTDLSMPLLELAKEAETRGLKSVVVPEHTHIPVSRATPWPRAGGMPEKYKRMLDPYIGLSFVAAQTALEIGTCVSLVAQHDPVALAKAIATLDHLSGGRFMLGVGYGWNREELAHHGHRFSERRQVVRDHICLMRSLWEQEEAAFVGESVRLESSWAWPKPVQTRLPVLLGGGMGPRNLQQMLEWSDGWLPVVHDDLVGLTEGMNTLRAAWPKADRSGEPIVEVMQGVVENDVIKRNLETYVSLGVRRVHLDLPTAERDVVLPILDRYAVALKTI